MSESSEVSRGPRQVFGRSALQWTGLGISGLVRLVLVLACFGLAYYTVDLLLVDDPLAYLVVFWFAGALVLHDLVLFPLYAGGDRILSLVLRVLPRTRVPLVNHVRIPVLGAGLTLLMFLPGIIQQGTAAHVNASGLDQQPYAANWVWLAQWMFIVSAAIWLLRTLAGMLVRAVRRSRGSPGRHQRDVEGEREQRLDGQPPADLRTGQQAAGQYQPDAER